MNAQIQNFCNILSELNLIDQYGQQILNKLGVDVAEDKVCKKSAVDTKPFYDALASTNISNDSMMAIAEDQLSCYTASAIGYKVEDLNVYDILRYRLLLGSNDKYIVVSGSLSGIQKFIFDVKSSKARKQITGRSFYLSLLIDGVVERIVRDFEVSRQSVLYSTGGAFSLLLPYNQESEQKLVALIADIKAKVYRTHQEQLVLLNYVVADRSDLESEPYPIFAKLQEQRNRDKYSPLYASIQNEYEHFLQPGTTPKSPIINQMDKLGAALGQMKYVLVSSQKVTGDKLISIEPGEFGIYYSLLTEENLPNSFADEANSTLIIYNEKPNKIIKYPWRLEYMAGFGESFLSFEDLLDNRLGVRRMGVLRMDVDNLGKTLRKAYEQKLPLASFAHKSRELDKFFKQRLHQIWLRDYIDSVIIIYSGGDDLFIVGNWVNVLKFAKTINQLFVETFSGDQISLSAGISLVESKFPIIRAAESAANEESVAKQFGYVDTKGISRFKQSISIFSTALRWNVEFKKIIDLCETWENLLRNQEKKEDNVVKALLRRILNYNESVTYNGREISPIRQIWLMSYDLARLKQRYQKRLSKEEEYFIDKCLMDIVVGNTIFGTHIDSPYHSLQLWAIAARLVELKVRNN